MGKIAAGLKGKVVVSFYTKIDIVYLDFPRFDFEKLTPQLEALMDKLRYSHDVIKDLKELGREGSAMPKLNSFCIIDLFSRIAPLDPKVPFALRGMGEHPRSVWVREYVDGKEVYAFGPPDEVDC